LLSLVRCLAVSVFFLPWKYELFHSIYISVTYDNKVQSVMLYCRKFGTTKRFSETDRREVTELIAAKLQLAHDEWRREADKVQTKLDDVREETRQMDERGVRVAVNIYCVYIYVRTLKSI